MSEETNTNQEPTPEELKQYRKNMLEFYKEQIPLLKNQKEYESLLADIEDAKLRRLTAIIRQAHLMNPPVAPGEEPGNQNQDPESDFRSEEMMSDESPKKRTLKKEE